MGDRTTAQVLDAPMGKNDARATTVRGFLVALLRRLWEDGEDFSGKRPFGNSGWQYAIHDAVLGPDASSVDTDPIILAAIDSLGAPPNLTAVLSDRDRLRALLAAYGRAVEEEGKQWSGSDEAAYLKAAAAADTAMEAIQAEAAKWREWG